MKAASTENAKVSDSGYSNTCSNSQSHRSSDSSISRNSNRSESSGYCGRRPSTLGGSDEALPRPISKRKDKEHKKKESKVALAVNNETENTLKNSVESPGAAPYSAIGSTKTTLEIKPEEVATVELVDATDPGEHSGDTAAEQEAGLASRTNPLDDFSSQANEGFCAVISMHDGLVLYTTLSICTALGYPKDSWIRTSFMDYVHPKDKVPLAEQITSAIASPWEDRPKGNNDRRTSLFCGLRKFSTCSSHLPNGQNKEARSNMYLPFHLTLTFRDFRDRAIEQQPRSMFLVVTAQPVHSAYKAPEETIMSSIFTTRHTATCHLSHVDPDVVQYFGYLPQDMVGRSLFDFYHPEDLPSIRNTYETVIKLEGRSFQSKPYRFKVQNGCHVVLDTEWSSFTNPWTRKLEFIVGRHRVLKGPIDPDVFRVSVGTDSSYLANISEEVLKESKVIQGEICALLDESVQRTLDIAERDVSKRCKDLAPFMESLLQEMKAPGLNKVALPGDDRSFSERDSVMLGEISPHREYYDSKSSTETPPSYNQLNYNENLERFFKSKPPVVTVYGSDEDNVVSSNDEGGKTSPTSAARRCTLPTNGSGSGSGENFSSGSNNQTSSASRGDTSNTTNNATKNFKPPTLTESLLNRHNEDMEKLMIQKHREFRSSIKNSDRAKDPRIKSAVENTRTGKSHGIKRSGSDTWKGDNFKVPKHDEVPRTSTAKHLPANPAMSVTSMNVNQSTVSQTTANITIWPPLSVTVSPPVPPQQFIQPQTHNPQAVPRFAVLPQMIPVRYVPVPQNGNGAELAATSLQSYGAAPLTQPLQSPYMSVPVSYMAGVIYPPVIATPPTGAMMYRSFLIPQQAPVSRETASELIVNKGPEQNRPFSQSVSIKAESGSITAMSESSKKVLPSEERLSSCANADGGCLSVVGAPTPLSAKGQRSAEYQGDESSSSSFYSSFSSKSSDSSDNPDLKMSDPPTTEEQVKRHQGMRKKEPPWLEGVQLTRELIYEYQLHPKALNEVLKADMDSLRNINQPLLVNEQLGQLYLDLELEGFETKLMLDDGITSSGSDSGSSSGLPEMPTQHKQRRSMMKYDKLVMIHEENASLPPPIST